MARSKKQEQWFAVVLIQSSGLELKRLPGLFRFRFVAEGKAEELNERLTDKEKAANHKWRVESCSPPVIKRKAREKPSKSKAMGK